MAQQAQKIATDKSSSWVLTCANPPQNPNISDYLLGHFIQGPNSNRPGSDFYYCLDTVEDRYTS